MARCPDHLGFPLSTSKQKGLAVKSENFPERYIVEIKQVISFLPGMSRKNAGEKNEGIFMLLKTN
jgi:hypothetical protein